VDDRRRQLLAALLLTVVAAVPRFYDLNRVGFWGDEDLTTLAARSLLEGEGTPTLPSGMPYLRALPFTWANAATAAILGPDSERSYRVTAAAFGTATPAALYLTGSAFVAPPAAFVAGAMLALSEHHIHYSRNARMYAPFLFFFVLTAFYLWRWASEGGRARLLVGLALFGVTTWLHLLGVIAVQFALIPLALRRSNGPSPWIVIGISLAAVAGAYLLTDAFIDAPYRAFALPRGFPLEGLPSRAAPESAGGRAGLALLPMVLGGLLGLFAGRRDLIRDEPGSDAGLSLRGAVLLLGWAATAAFLAGGHLWGAAQAGAVLLLIHPDPILTFARRSWRVILMAFLASLAWTAYAVVSLGLADGVRRLVLFPFPNLALLWDDFPGLIILFLGAVLWMVSSSVRVEHRGLVGALLAVLLPLAAIGLVRDWAPDRYMIEAYPYMLLAAAALMVQVSRWATAARPTRRARAVVLGAPVVLVLAGVTGGHGVVPAARAAFAKPGDFMDSTTMLPDHRGPGEYVRRNLASGDVVITEHPDAQIIYAGQVDYWLRRAGDARAYLHLGEDGVPRDDYTGGRLLPTVRSIDEALGSAQGKVWLITSGETFLQRDFYLTEEQRLWLDSVETNTEPEFTGADGVTKVYCLNCQR
jgi:hypothetical protein